MIQDESPCINVLFIHTCLQVVSIGLLRLRTNFRVFVKQDQHIRGSSFERIYYYVINDAISVTKVK